MVLEFHELEFHQKIFDNFEGYFFKELKFKQLKNPGKLDFSELKYLKNNRSLHIFEIVVNWYISR